MRNNITDAREILHQALIDANLGIPLAYENNEFQPDAHETWGAVFYLPNIAEPVSLGSFGDDELTGVFQIDIYTPTNTGEAVALGLLQKLRIAFSAGRVYKNPYSEVLIKRSGQNPSMNAGVFHKSTFSAFFSNRIKRN